jgi:simple sugar transport system ATP-binding protein
VHEVADRLIVLERGAVAAEIRPAEMSVAELTDFLISLQHET